MSNTNLETWDKLKRPPASALKTITAGRLKNMSDVNPQWRYQAMTEAFGVCGVGWKYEIKKLWLEPASESQVIAFCEVALFIHGQEGWSAAIPGIGGSMLIAKEKSGMHSSDEAYKMATTDALSVAMKMIGIAADIYMGRWDGSKYKDMPVQTPEAAQVDENVKRAVSEWKQNIDTLAETAPLATIKAYWAPNKAAIIKDCGNEQAAEVRQYLIGVANRIALAEGAA